MPLKVIHSSSNAGIRSVQNIKMRINQHKILK